MRVTYYCSGYNEAAAKEALEKRIPQYFVPWSYAEHVKMVKGSERVGSLVKYLHFYWFHNTRLLQTKGRTILNSYVKLRSTKNRRQLLDYYFRYE